MKLWICPVRATGGPLPCGCYLLASFTGNKEESKGLMVLRVKPTPTRLPTNSLYTPVDSTPLYPTPSLCCPALENFVVVFVVAEAWHLELTRRSFMNSSGLRFLKRIIAVPTAHNNVEGAWTRC